ncbi:MAG: flagellar export chaperone FlgN [Thermodesulfobacteriota bacterium]|nr:flagellar export chaperone FlgN [Thermodesulfobacteriota bacterium]
MEDEVIRLVEKLFFKKIMLYNDLLHYLKEERESLISIDLDKLWRISKGKEEACADIESTRKEIISALSSKEDQKSFNLNRIMEFIPGKFKAEFQNLYLRILKIKGEVEVLRIQNMTFIDDSLNFMDDIISIITGESESRIVYNDKCRFSKPIPNLFLNREV